MTRSGLVVLELEDGDLPPEAYTHRLPLGKAVKESTWGKVTICLSYVAVEVLGEPGRLLSGSKTAYANRYPDHQVLFNACLFDHSGVEIWFGDIDLTRDQASLEQLAERVGPITLTPEQPYRFEGLDKHGGDRRIRVYRPRREK